MGLKTMADIPNDTSGAGGKGAVATTALGQQQGHPILTFEAFCQLMWCNLAGMEGLMQAYSAMAGGSATVVAISPLATTTGGARVGTPTL